MSIFKKFVDSSKELGSVQTLTICAMMLALRVILGIFANSLLPFLSYVKIGLSFIPVVIVAILYGPVCAGIVNGLGDVLSIILNNPTAFSINPGITLCCVLEGILYGIVLYQTELRLSKVIIAKLAVLLCTIPLYSLVLYPIYQVPYLTILWFRTAALVPYAVIEVILIYYMWKLLDRLIKSNHIKV